MRQLLILPLFQHSSIAQRWSPLRQILFLDDRRLALSAQHRIMSRSLLFYSFDCTDSLWYRLLLFNSEFINIALQCHPRETAWRNLHMSAPSSGRNDPHQRIGSPLIHEQLLLTTCCFHLSPFCTIQSMHIGASPNMLISTASTSWRLCRILESRDRSSALSIQLGLKSTQRRRRPWRRASTCTH